jgi:arylsulfatase A
MTRKPNIVYLLADDMGYGDLSCLNADSKIHTAHLDRVAASGVIFTDAHASSAICTPSRYSILTGRYCWRSSLKKEVTWGYSGHLIEASRLTVASYLKQNGYHTAMIGKWHLGWDWSTSDGKPAQEDGGNVDFNGPVINGPDSYGFDYFYAISASLDMPPYVYVENGLVTGQPDRVTENTEKFTWWRKGPTGADFHHEDVLPNFTRKSLGYIEERAKAGGSFFLYFPLPAPHNPMLPTAEFLGRSSTNIYGDFCLQVDDTVGQIAAALEQNGLEDNTILIFTSDNGCSPIVDFEQLAALGHHPSHVFRGAKADIYEGGHRIPLIVRWPKEIRARSVSTQTVCLSDLLRTCSEIIGTPLPENAGEDSVSNLPAWKGMDKGITLRAETVHHSIDGSFSIRKGSWKLETCAGSGGWSFPRPGKECEGLPPIQLYDLDLDVGEQKNVADHYPNIVEELLALLTKYIENGRSTPGARQENDGGVLWEQLWWMLPRTKDKP